MIELINMFMTVFDIEYYNHNYIYYDVDIYDYEKHLYIEDNRLPNWFKNKIKYIYV